MMENSQDKKVFFFLMKNTTPTKNGEKRHNTSWQTITGDGHFTYLSQIYQAAVH